MPAVLGYDDGDLRRLRELAGGPLERPQDIARILDRMGYLDEWRSRYAIKSVRASLHGDRITCIDAAIFSYGVLELCFPDTPRKLLAIHRVDRRSGEECGHCVALWWNRDGRCGSFSKSSYPGLGHRAPKYLDEAGVAMSYAMAYVKMGITPLYYGVTTLEEAAPDLDWRFSTEALNVLSERLQERYAFAFGEAA